MNFDCTKSMILQGGKSKFSQIIAGESTLNFVIWCHEDLKPKNLQITRLESKETFLQGKPEIANITRDNHILTIFL